MLSACVRSCTCKMPSSGFSSYLSLTGVIIWNHDKQSIYLTQGGLHSCYYKKLLTLNAKYFGRVMSGQNIFGQELFSDIFTKLPGDYRKWVIYGLL